jgi:hypothetical protein
LCAAGVGCHTHCACNSAHTLSLAIKKIPKIKKKLEKSQKSKKKIVTREKADIDIFTHW